LGIGDWGLGIGPNPQSPIPNPQSPIPNPHFVIINKIIHVKIYLLNIYKKYLINKNNNKHKKLIFDKNMKNE